jgi:hypothetical protein
MKKLFWVLCIVLPLMYSPIQAKEVPKTKVVCTSKQKCKTVKIHKKLQGTKVPAEAKKKK